MAEEHEQLVETLQEALASLQATIHTATIAKVTAVNQNTIDCQCVISRFVNGDKKELSVFADVPVITLQGGGNYQTYPVAVGDYCLMFFTERCFDRWWAGDDNQLPAEYRMHDYSDGFALVGINPLATALDIPSTIKRVGDIVMEGGRTHTGDTQQTGNHTLTGNMDAGAYLVGGVAGWTGTFATGDSRTVTVINGIITKVA